MKLNKEIESTKQSTGKAGIFNRLKSWSGIKVRKLFGILRRSKDNSMKEIIVIKANNELYEKELSILKDNLAQVNAELSEYKKQVEKKEETEELKIVQPPTDVKDDTEELLMSAIEEAIRTVEESRIMNESFFEIETLKSEETIDMMDNLRVTLDCDIEEKAHQLLIDLIKVTKLNHTDELIQNVVEIFKDARQKIVKSFELRIEEITEALLTQRNKMEMTERRFRISSTKTVSTLKNTRRKTEMILAEK
ncbi:unnamed protein product [Dimorphilus gyrociliatus]|uniref:Uncharacterized protein n=1 Tax=Dimorphilus gyrociliatus TaxID=2664684 RepID=A0A7I8WB08_9ANNE|nr:unnamed protein product [Dimorphilus gyrociliatus]